MGRRPNVYGLDIETDTTVDGLDSEVAPVVTVALSLDDYDEVFSGDEPSILTRLDRRLAELTSGVLATWNGAAFDLPFLADRARCSTCRSAYGCGTTRASACSTSRCPDTRARTGPGGPAWSHRRLPGPVCARMSGQRLMLHADARVLLQP